MGDGLQVSPIDRPCPDVALVDGILLNAANLRDRLPNVTIHVGVDVDALDRRVVKAAHVRGTEEGEPVGV